MYNPQITIESHLKCFKGVANDSAASFHLENVYVYVYGCGKVRHGKQKRIYFKTAVLAVRAVTSSLFSTPFLVAQGNAD